MWKTKCVSHGSNFRQQEVIVSHPTSISHQHRPMRNNIFQGPGSKNPFVIELSYSKIRFVGIKVITILVMSNNKV